jgi:hypothetical protein
MEDDEMLTLGKRGMDIIWERHNLMVAGPIKDRNDLHQVLSKIRDERKSGFNPYVIVFSPKERGIKMGTIETEVERYEMLKVLEAALILTDPQFGGTDYND